MNAKGPKRAVSLTAWKAVRANRTPDDATPENVIEVDTAEFAAAFARGEPAVVETVRRKVAAVLAHRGFGMAPDQRQDLEQDVMTQLWQAASRPDFEPGEAFLGFANVVTSRRCIDWLRTRKPRTEPLDVVRDGRQSPLGRLLAEERHEQAYGILAGLPKPCRDLIFLHAGLELPYKKISELLGRSEGALRVQLHRCVGEARRLLKAQRLAGDEKRGAS